METLKCKNCGAPINPNKDKCDYCDTYFKSTPNEFIDPHIAEQYLVMVWDGEKFIWIKDPWYELNHKC